MGRWVLLHVSFVIFLYFPNFIQSWCITLEIITLKKNTLKRHNAFNEQKKILSRNMENERSSSIRGAGMLGEPALSTSGWCRWTFPPVPNSLFLLLSHPYTALLLPTNHCALLLPQHPAFCGTCLPGIPVGLFEESKRSSGSKSGCDEHSSASKVQGESRWSPESAWDLSSSIELMLSAPRALAALT